MTRLNYPESLLAEFKRNQVALQFAYHVQSHWGHCGYMEYASISPNGEWVATITHDGTIKWWDTHKWAVETISTGLYSFNTVKFSPTGKLLASADGLGRLCIWNAESKEIFKTLETNTYILHLLWSPDERMILSFSQNHRLHVFSIDSGLLIGMMEIKTDSEDGDLASLSADWLDNHQIIVVNTEVEEKAFHLWKIPSNSHETLPLQFNCEILGVSASPDKKSLLIGNFIELWLLNAATFDILHHFQIQGISGFEWAPDSNGFCIYSPKNPVELWDLQQHKICQFEVPLDHTCHLIWECDMIAIWGAYISMKIYNISTQTWVFEFPRSSLYSWEIALDWSPRGDQLAWIDGLVHIMDFPSGDELCTFSPFKHSYSASNYYNIAWSPDGSSIATTAIDDPLSFWNPITGVFLFSLHADGDDRSRKKILFSPDNKWVALIAIGCFIRIWHLETHDLYDTIQQGDSAVWSSDSKFLAIENNKNNIVSIWDIKTKQLNTWGIGKIDMLNKICWIPDSRFFPALEPVSRDRLDILWNNSVPFLFEDIVANLWYTNSKPNPDKNHEQLKGFPSDPQSDIYWNKILIGKTLTTRPVSLGIVWINFNSLFLWKVVENEIIRSTKRCFQHFAQLCDAKFNPCQPHLLAAIDEQGDILIWDIYKDMNALMKPEFKSYSMPKSETKKKLHKDSP